MSHTPIDLIAMRWKLVNRMLPADFDSGCEAEIEALVRSWSLMRRNTWSDDGFGD